MISVGLLGAILFVGFILLMEGKFGGRRLIRCAYSPRYARGPICVSPLIEAVELLAQVLPTLRPWRRRPYPPRAARPPAPRLGPPFRSPEGLRKWARQVDAMARPPLLCSLTSDALPSAALDALRANDTYGNAIG